MVSSPAYALETYDNFLKVMHTFAGLYIWEYLTTFGFEWNIYTGKRPWRWSYIPYIATRLLCLSSLIVLVVGVNLKREFNCDAWLRGIVVRLVDCPFMLIDISQITGWPAASGASFLLLLRAVAIWSLDRRVVVFATLVWLFGFSGSLFAITRGHSKWSPLVQTCSLMQVGTDEYKWILMTGFVVNVTLLGTMIVGVIHKRLDTRLWKLLYYQGMFWISAAVFTEVPGVVMPFLNINDPWNMMFQVPLLVVLVIASSRSYRDLFQHVIDDCQCNHHSRPPIIGSDSLLVIGMTRSGMEKHVAIKKTIESDIRFAVPNTSVLASVSVPSRMEDEERGFCPEAQKRNDTEA
ncbi:hypothetical protein BGW80DRAFT_517465 [Lactifluus volemus]|nr:hypothetical protein BGW80DRAFT_517465 [Lactifluus volemus]